MAIHDFSTWSSGMPVGWAQLNDAVGDNSNIVSVTQSGKNAIVAATQPTSGLLSSESVDVAGTVNVQVTPASGKVAAFPADEFGCSTAFSRISGDASFRWTSANGDLMELQDDSDETTSGGGGDIFFRRNGGEWYKAVAGAAGFAPVPVPGVLWTGTKHVLLILYYEADADMGVWAIDLDADSNVVEGTGRVLVFESGKAFEVYTAVAHSNGNIYFVASRFAAPYVNWDNAVLYMYRSTDGLQTVQQVAGPLSRPSGHPGGGFGESYSVELSTGIIRTYTRGTAGYILSSDYNPTNHSWVMNGNTPIVSPNCALGAANLSDGSIALAWFGSRPSTNAALPNVLLCFAISDDDEVTWRDYQVLDSSTRYGVPLAPTGNFRAMNQPAIFQDPDGSVHVYYRQHDSLAEQTSGLAPWIHATATNPRIGNNVSSGTGQQTVSYDSPEGSRVAIVSAFDAATFTATTVTQVIDIPGAIDFSVTMPLDVPDAAIDFDITMPQAQAGAIDFTISMPLEDPNPAHLAEWTEDTTDTTAWTEDTITPSVWTE